MPAPLRIVKPAPAVDVEGLLRSAGATTTAVTYQPKDVIFSQGDAAHSVIYIQEGVVKLSVSSSRGKEAVVAILGAGAFLGERAVVDDPVRHETVTAITATAVLIIAKAQVLRLLREQREFSGRFIAHMLARNIRLEEDVVDQVFNSSEKRLARALLLLARCGRAGTTRRVRPRISQQTLAEMIGTTRSRVNFFMNKFKKLGYIECGGGLKVNDSLVAVLLRDDRVDGGAAVPEQPLIPSAR